MFFASQLNFLAHLGPLRHDCSATSAKLIAGLPVFLYSSCAEDTRMYAQWVHIADTTIVAKIPKTSPEALKAAGIDKIPVPNEAFRR